MLGLLRLSEDWFKLGTEEFKTWKLYKALGAEFLGTMLLVLVGCGSCMHESTSVLRISLAFGLTVAVLVQFIGKVSGCHVNPAVTVGLHLAGKMTIMKSGAYIFAQCMGAQAGAIFLYFAVPNATNTKLGQTMFGGNVTWWNAIAIELIITFVLVLLVCSVCDEFRDDMNGSPGLAIGLSITACHLAAVGLTGSSMNPARSFGPAAAGFSIEEAKALKQLWIYCVGPMMGGTLAGLTYYFCFSVTAMDECEEFWKARKEKAGSKDEEAAAGAGKEKDPKSKNENASMGGSSAVSAVSSNSASSPSTVNLPDKSVSKSKV